MTMQKEDAWPIWTARVAEIYSIQGDITQANNLLKDRKSMLVTTTPIIEGKRIVKYYGIVSGETIIGANVFRDIFASIRDIVGGRSGAYEEVLRMAKDTALQEMQAQAAQMGANAVIGVDLDYETVGGSGSMLMVTANGTAVTIED